MEHKHAAVLRAIADGVPFDRIEINRHGNGWDDYARHDDMYLVGSYTEAAEFRIKPAETVSFANVYHDLLGNYKKTTELADSDSRAESRIGVIKITIREDGTFDVEKV